LRTRFASASQSLAALIGPREFANGYQPRLFELLRQQAAPDLLMRASIMLEPHDFSGIEQ